MVEKLTGNDVAFILESLRYTRMKFENYPYDSEDFRKDQLSRVDDVVTKVKACQGTYRSPMIDNK